MKYFKHAKDGNVIFYQPEIQPEGIHICIPHAPDNMDFVRMMQEIDAGTSTIEEVED